MASAKPARSSACTGFGTISGSQMPQSAALLTTMRSTPYSRTIFTMRGGSIFVFG